MVGVDSNMCCGTHVSNLSHLQAVKLLHTESKQGLTLLYFVGGNRVCNLLEKCYQIPCFPLNLVIVDKPSSSRYLAFVSLF